IDDLEDALDRIFQALADPRRRMIMRLVAARPRTVTELGRDIDASMAGVSKHVRALRVAELISVRREGRLHWCELGRHAFELAAATLDDVRERASGRIDPIEAYFERIMAPLRPKRLRKRRRAG